MMKNIVQGYIPSQVEEKGLVSTASVSGPI